MYVFMYIVGMQSLDSHCTFGHTNEYTHTQLSEAKSTLSQHPQMLQELKNWEDSTRTKELLTCSNIPLTGKHISVCNVQQPHSWIAGAVASHNLQTKVGLTTFLCSLENTLSFFFCTHLLLNSQLECVLCCLASITSYIFYR